MEYSNPKNGTFCRNANGGNATSKASTSPHLAQGEAETKDFESVYPDMVNRLIQESMPDMQIMDGGWLRHLLDYNIVGGKQLRGRLVPATYKCLVKKEPTPEDMQRAYVLGWIIEVVQAASLVADDLVDESETRRGKPCWYKWEEVGLSAVRDYRLLINVSFKLLKIYFEDKPYYNELFNCMIDILHKTVAGQGLDCISSRAEDIKKNFTMKRYNAIVKYKTSYAIYFPIAFAMILAGKSLDQASMQKLESVLLQIGHYFQVQDDYLDCFGDESETGKGGTDIQDNKCSWLIVKALELTDPEEELINSLVENYGRSDPTSVGRVKRLYRHIKLPMLYANHELETQKKIMQMIKELPGELDEQIFTRLFLSIYRRRK